MKTAIISILLCLTVVHFIYAQGSSKSTISQISTPFKYLNDGAFYGRNFIFEKKWVRAKLLLADNSVINSDSILYNYDKIDHRLLITSDFKQIYEVDRREFKAVLFYLADTAYIFKHINFINDRYLFQVIVNETSKYSLYKLMRTKLVKSSYGGSSVSGPRASDTYLDAPEYYIFFPNREYRTIQMLKKPSIEKAFNLNPDSGKVTEYLNMGGSHEFSEKDLIRLILYLNSGSM